MSNEIKNKIGEALYHFYLEADKDTIKDSLKDDIQDMAEYEKKKKRIIFLANAAAKKKHNEYLLQLAEIETDKRIYLLKSELTFRITHDDKKSFVIENQMLDIFAQGENLAKAELDLFEQFDFTYRRLLEIDDDKLSRPLLDAKKYITLIVDTVKDK